MSQQTQSTMSVRSRGRRVRVMAGALLSAGILLVAAACGDKGGDPPSGDSGDGGSNVKSVIDGLKVCELVDLQPLVTTLESPGYAQEPTDVPQGSGVISAGPSCAAQPELPQLKDAAGIMKEIVPARLNVSVAAYATQSEADQAFAGHLAESEKFEGAATEDLSGAWTTGKVITAELTTEDVVQALVQKDTYIVRIYLQVSSDANMQEQFSFTLADVKTSVTETLGKLFTAVSAKAEG